MATTKMLRRFTFKDLSLAFKVRENVWNALVIFDQNYNQLFQSDEIRKALVSILNEDQMQVQYVVNNVFRYDTDGDHAVTYTQFTNFCVEQHFGEMAIQRLHRMGYYQNGANRAMSLPEFQVTLNYCLQTINSKGTHSQYQRLFQEVDLDRNGLISYQDYFIFLREYFGSQSQAFEQEQKNPRPLPPRPSIVSIGISEAQQRFCCLVYSQFKISVIEKDRNKNMGLQKSEIQQILSSVLRLSYNQISKLRQKCMSNQNAVSYESFIRNSIVYYMSDQQLHRLSSQQKFNQTDFIEFILKICHFVQIKPSEEVLKICFRDASRGSMFLSAGDFCSFMKNMFQNYRFDTRGLHRGLNIYAN